MNRRRGIRFLVLLILELIALYLVDSTTFRYQTGGTISGNGNPGLIMLAVAVLLFVFLFRYTFLWFYRIFQANPGRRKTSLLVAISALIVLLASAIFQSRKVEALKLHLNGFTKDEGSVVYRFGWINQYTNNLFFNAYILAAGISLAVILAWVLSKFIKK